MYRTSTCRDSIALMMPQRTQLPELGDRLYLFLMENARPSLVWGLVLGPSTEIGNASCASSLKRTRPTCARSGRSCMMNFLQVVRMKSQWSLMFIICEFSSTITYLGAACLVTVNRGIVKLLTLAVSRLWKSSWLITTLLTELPRQKAWWREETDTEDMRGSKSSKTPYRRRIHWLEIILPSCEELEGARKE